MKFSALFIASLSFIPSLIAAVAIPDIAARNETLVKRGGEVNYLSNCLRVDTHSGWPLSSYTASYIAWYSNIDNTQSGNDVRLVSYKSLLFHHLDPDLTSSILLDANSSAPTRSPTSDYLHWEGQQQDIYFPDSAASIQTHIDGDAQGRAFQAYAGWAQRTSDGKKFNCYKDNGRQLFVWGTPVPDGTDRGIICQAIYYCV
ncbi:hypothetical protein FRC01_006778 [Tulasnella sp. 417]|nr:hypothetical protein FRC01_006778 [Tulasnella sp. 417]